jgi:hypothetical protein
MVAGKYSSTFKNKFVEDFIDDVSASNSSYYVAFGRGYEWPDDYDPPATNSSILTSYLDVSKDLMFGKKLSVSDIQYCARKITWASNTVYDYYDHTDPDLYNREFYVMNSDKRVYKCLYNNRGAPSTVEPTATIATGDFKTSDGYIWKYMYTINSLQNKKFTSVGSMPVIPDYYVPQYATEGAIHVVVVDSLGNGYEAANGYCDVSVNPSLIKLANSGPSSINGAYNLSTIYIAAGTGRGDYSIISDYTVNTSGKYVTTLTQLNNIDSTSFYKISPTVNIVGDGTGALALSTVNSISGAITSIDVIDNGQGYHYATATIVANTLFGSNCYIHPIISPPGGHGSDVISELGVDRIGISLDINTTDNFPEWATYRQVSLLYNPLATANNTVYKDSTFVQYIVLNITNVFAPMAAGEQVYGFTSGATGTVLYMDADILVLRETIGTFIPFETITSSTSGITCTPTAINNRDLVPYSGKIYYYRNLEPISRSGASSEQVKLYFKI